MATARAMKRMMVVLTMAAVLVACKPKSPVDPKPCRTEHATLETAVAAFEAEHGRLPVSMAELAPLLKHGTVTTWWTLGLHGTAVPMPGVVLPAGCP